MEDRLPKGVRYELSRCTTPAAESQWHRWYNHVHIPDLEALGPWRHPTRYRQVTSTIISEPMGQVLSQGTFLTLWETDQDDIEGAERETIDHIQRLQSEGRISPYNQVVWQETFRLHGRQGNLEGRHPTGFFVAFSSCNDPTADEEFNHWYDTIHVADMLREKLYHTAYRFRACTPRPDEPTYIAIYETDGADPAKVQRDLSRHGPIGETSPLLEVFWYGSFKRIYPPKS